MNGSKKIVLGIVVGFAFGVVVGQTLPLWNAPADAAASAAMPADHAAMMGQEGSPHGEPVASGSNEQCNMNCATDRPPLEAKLLANPEDPEALIKLGACDLDMGDRALGLERLARGIALAKDPALLVEAGICLARGQQAEQAIDAFDKSLVLDPKNSDALYRAGLIAFHELGNNQLAARYWTMYLEVAPDAPNADLIRRSVDHFAAAPATTGQGGFDAH